MTNENNNNNNNNNNNINNNSNYDTDITYDNKSLKYNENSCEKLLELYKNCLTNQQNNCDFLQDFILKKCNN
jgi:hypothetical protein